MPKVKRTPQVKQMITYWAGHKLTTFTLPVCTSPSQGI